MQSRRQLRSKRPARKRRLAGLARWGLGAAIALAVWVPATSTASEHDADALLRRLRSADAAVRASAVAEVQEWHQEILGAFGVEERRSAEAVFADRVFPELARRLSSSEESIRGSAAEALLVAPSVDAASAKSVMKTLSSPQDIVRRASASVIASVVFKQGLGEPDRTEWIRALGPMVADPDDGTSDLVVRALARIGAESKPYLLAGFLVSPQAVAERCGVALVGLRLSVEEFRLVGDRIETSAGELRTRAAWILASAPLDGDLATAELGRTVQTLRSCLGAVDQNLVNECAHALGRLGSRARVALPDLIRALGHDHGIVREAAIDAIRLVGPPPEALEPIADRLKDSYWPARRAAAQALPAIGRAAVTTLPRLEAARASEVEPQALRAIQAAIQELQRLSR